MNRKNNPIRTCIICREKFEQNRLHRFKINDFNFTRKNSGRSFYLCSSCIKKDDKILKKAMSKFVKNSDLNLEKLKESVLDGRCSNK